MISKIVFADKKVKEAYEKLKVSTTEDRMLYDWLTRAFGDLEKDAFCGIQLPKRLMPKEYVKKYGIDNLWKYEKLAQSYYHIKNIFLSPRLRYKPSAHPRTQLKWQQHFQRTKRTTLAI